MSRLCETLSVRLCEALSVSLVRPSHLCETLSVSPIGLTPTPDPHDTRHGRKRPTPHQLEQAWA